MSLCLLFPLPSTSLLAFFFAIRSRFPNLYLDSWTAPSVSLRPRMAPKKPSSTAEVALVPLKNCLVNLPPSLVALLVNANTVSSSSNFFFISDWFSFSLVGADERIRLRRMSLSSCSTDRRPGSSAGTPRSGPATWDGPACRASANLRRWSGEMESTIPLPPESRTPRRSS